MVFLLNSAQRTGTKLAIDQATEAIGELFTKIKSIKEKVRAGFPIIDMVLKVIPQTKRRAPLVRIRIVFLSVLFAALLLAVLALRSLLVSCSNRLSTTGRAV